MWPVLGICGRLESLEQAELEPEQCVGEERFHGDCFFTLRSKSPWCSGRGIKE